MDYQNLNIKIPIYTPSDGFKFEWEKGFIISVSIDNETMVLSANEEGLKSLAKH